MDLEHLTKTQLVLLGLLISFVTSMATAIFTVSLVNQAPPPITNTINRVVERIIDPMGTNKKIEEEKNKNQQPEFISKEDAIVKVVKDVSPAVVSVFETEDNKSNGRTGFFVSADGIIITNKSFAGKKEAEYSVLTHDGKRLKAKVLAVDPLQDLVMLKVDGKGFSVAELGDSDKLNVGQTVVAVGNTLGESSSIVSIGIISGLNRKMATQSGLTGVEDLRSFIQTDAAINLGNSGGPLLDINGKVVGVNMAGNEITQGVSFALMVNFIKRDMQDIKEFGAVQYPQLKTGIETGDTVLEVDGVKINQENTLSTIITKYRVGDKLNLKILRDGKESEVSVTLEKRPEGA